MNRLKILREEKGLYQIDVAKELNITSQAYGLYESEKRDMGINTILKLADFFNVSTDYLLGRTTIRNPKEYLEEHLSQYKLTSQEYDEIIGDLINNRRFDLFLLDIDNAPTRKQEIHSDILRVYFDYLSSSGIAYTEENFDPEKAQKEQEPIDNFFIELLKSLDKNKIIVDGNSNIDEDKLNVAFSSGYDGLNETNKNIILSQIEFLTAKQKENDKKTN